VGPQLRGVNSRCGLSAFHVAQQRDHPFVEFIGWLWDNRLVVGSTIAGYVGAVRKRLNLAFVAAVPASPLVDMILVRLKQVPYARRFSDPVPSSVVAAIIADGGTDLGVRAAFAVMWFCALRVGSVTSSKVSEFDPEFCIRRADVSVVEGAIRINVPSSKSDKFNAGVSFWVLPTGGPGCPVRLIQEFMAATMGRASQEPFFQHVHAVGGRASSLITRAQIAHVLRLFGRKLGVDTSHLTPHGVRVGAATAAVTAGLSLEDILLLGRWSSEDSALCYLRLSVPRAQRITDALSLEEHFDASGRRVLCHRADFLLPTRRR